MKGQGTRVLLAAALAAAGCAANAGQVRFPSRRAPASTTVADDDALMAAGYVSLGPLRVAVEKERCRGTDQAPRDCEPVDPSGQSGALLLTKAASRGGDLVRVASYETPTTMPWIETDCDGVLYSPSRIATVRGAFPSLTPEEPVCVKKENVVGIRRWSSATAPCGGKIELWSRTCAFSEPSRPETSLA
jgi:hypothetical protein